MRAFNVRLSGEIHQEWNGDHDPPHSRSDAPRECEEHAVRTNCCLNSNLSSNQNGLFLIEQFAIIDFIWSTGNK